MKGFLIILTNVLAFAAAKPGGLGFAGIGLAAPSVALAAPAVVAAPALAHVSFSGPVSTGAILSGPRSAGAILTGPQTTGAILTTGLNTGTILASAPVAGLISGGYAAAPALSLAGPVALSAPVAIATPAVAYSSPLHVSAGVVTKGGGTIGVSGAGAIVSGPPTAPVLIAGPSGKIKADGLWGPTLEGLPYANHY